MIFLMTIHIPLLRVGRKYDTRDRKILTMRPDLQLFFPARATSVLATRAIMSLVSVREGYFIRRN